MEDPDLWPFMSIPTASGDRLTRHPRDAEAQREEMERLGWRLHRDLATHKLVHPGGSSFPWLASVGLDLVDVNTPEEAVPPLAREVPDISGLSLEQKSALLLQLREQGLGSHDQPPPSSDGGAEVTQ